MVHPTITAPIDGVSHAQVFPNDHLARVGHAHTDAYSLGSADRSEWVQTQAGTRSGAGYDGGLVPSVFEVDYRIGNSDWKLRVSPNGRECFLL